MVNNNEPTRRGRTNGEESSGSDAAVNFDPDLGLMSFQAQLALAIIESQRQVLENGGYNGGGNNSNTSNEVGVTDEAKQKWKSYEWGVPQVQDSGDEQEEEEGEEDSLKQLARTSSLEAIIERAGGGGGGGGLGGSSRDYGSVSTVDLTEDESHHDIEEQKQQQKKNKNKKTTSSSLDKISPSKLDGGLLSSFDNNEEPSCSICLCEYEHGERVTKLPCGHIYHETCLNSWTANHFRCPLCNYDLMDGYEQPLSAQQRARQRNLEEQRAFRTMALSTLGRRIRTSRRSSRTGNNNNRRAAALAAAAEDSIV